MRAWEKRDRDRERKEMASLVAGSDLEQRSMAGSDGRGRCWPDLQRRLEEAAAMPAVLELAASDGGCYGRR